MGQARRLDSVRLLWCVPIASSLLACAAQVESDYRGEPLATLHGSVTASTSSLESDVSATILWSTTDIRHISERVDVEGSFPANFTLGLFAPPPPEAQITTRATYCIDGELINTIESPTAECAGRVLPVGTGMGFWLGYAAALDSSVADGEIDRDDIVGIDVDHFILYFAHDEDEPLPEMPTDEQLARHLKLADADYEGPRDVGYHIGSFNPDHRAARQEARECKWEGVCVHWTHAEGPMNETRQDRADWDFRRCTEHFPENPTCSAFVIAEGEPASSTACREQYDNAADHDCNVRNSGPSTIENPDDLDAPITIQLGLTYWDVLP